MAETGLTILFVFITDPIKKYVFAPIKTHISYVFNCHSNVKELEDGVKQLKIKRDRLQVSVDTKTRNTENIFSDVAEKLSAAESDIKEADNLIQGKDDAMKKKCFVGFCPNLKTRYQLGKAAAKKASDINKLMNEFPQRDYNEIASQPHLDQIVPAPPEEELPSRVLLLNQIMDALRDPNVNMIGVYGMGGVGKTTLAREVQRKAVAEKLFDDVIFVAVSQTQDLISIQGVIADFLELKFEAKELQGRASHLNKRLEKSKVLIILDDLRQVLHLNDIGIPFGVLNKGPCKIMLTSRDSDLLYSEMGAQQLFSVGTLGEVETWKLFEMSVAEAKDPRFNAIATEIANKCTGLPFLIQLVGSELKGKEIHAWYDMLYQLSTSELGENDRVYLVLKSSYDDLSVEMKSFFLLCAMFVQSNIRIQHLLTHSMGLGLLRRDNIEAARNKVLTMIDRLKAKSLLLDGDIDGCVNMHDLVRDTALSIAVREQHAFIDIGLSDWPNKDCTRISLSCSDVHEFPVDLDCPEAELLLLFTEDLSLQIPDSFFEGINKLKVIDFTGMRLVSLPSSIGSLTNLRTLCLHRCQLDNMAMVGELKQLESLSFANSNIVELPRELEALTRLKILDLRNCSGIKVIPENVFSKLRLLEELYMLHSFVGWNAIGNASLVELDNLSHLSTLEIQIVNPTLIPQGCRFFHGLRSKSYKISIGDESGYWRGNDVKSRELKLKLDAGIDQLKDGIKVLLSDTEDLYLSNVGGIESKLFVLDLVQDHGFQQMKHLQIQNHYGLQHIQSSCLSFPKLETLNLKNIMSLEKICYGKFEMRSFGELRMVKISYCDKLKSLFSTSSAKCLLKLREMEVEFCKNVEDIVGDGSGDEHYNNEAIEFIQLSSLKLWCLPNLTGFCRRKELISPMEVLLNEMVSFPNLTSLEVSNCKSLKCVFTTSMLKCLVQLKKLQIGNCELVEEIIQSKKDEEIVQESIDAIKFPNLDFLSLCHLPNVKTFCCGYSVEFPSLKELMMTSCRAMKNFVSKVSRNESDDEEYFFNEMVTFSNLETMYFYDMNNFKYLWDKQFTPHSFSKLKSLNIYECSRLSVVFPSNACRRFQILETLYLSNCDGVEVIYEYQKIDFIEYAFSLRDLRIYELHSLKNIWSNDPCGAFTFENLQSVEVECCEDLRYVFPASIASGLQKLQQLEISNCNNMEVIIGKEKDERSDPSFLFPELTMLKLEDLKEMRSLYEGPHTFQCPKLNHLELLQLSNIFFVDSKFIANNLEELRLNEQGINAIQPSVECKFSVDKLKKITLLRLGEESFTPIVFGFLRRLKSLEMLVFQFCDLKEIFFQFDKQRPIGDRKQLRNLLTVRHLELTSVWELKHITIKKKDSQLINNILQDLQSLNIQYCHDLMNIAPSLASFQNLTTLTVQYCNKMTSLVTASTAKTMVQLMELKVSDCEMIKEIVAKDADSAEHDVIIFRNLKRLELFCLPKFNSFCSNNYNFNFPLLEEATITGCPRIKISVAEA